MKGDKRGSHVGVVISFVIFVTFLVFLYSILSPAISSEQNKESISEHLELELIEKISAELTTVSVNVVTGGSTCIELDNLINELSIGANIIVKDDSGQTVSSYIRSDALQIERQSTSDIFFKVYYSPEFGELATGSGCTNRAYEFGLTKTEEYIFESKMLDLVNDYGNYESLKIELKIPEGTEFGFGIVRQNGTETQTNGEEMATNIYIKKIPIQYVDEDGNILSGYLKTKIW